MSTTSTLPSREDLRAMAVDTLRRSPDRTPVPRDVMRDILIREFHLSPSDRGWIDFHLDEANGPKTATHLRVIDHDGETCLVLDEWLGQNAFEFDAVMVPSEDAVQPDDATKPTRRVRPAGVRLRKITSLLEDNDYDAICAEAVARQWSRSHMAAWIIGEWRKQAR